MPKLCIANYIPPELINMIRKYYATTYNECKRLYKITNCINETKRCLYCVDDISPYDNGQPIDYTVDTIKINKSFPIHYLKSIKYRFPCLENVIYKYDVIPESINNVITKLTTIGDGLVDNKILSFPKLTSLCADGCSMFTSSAKLTI
jgi:hypothetical protein